MRRRSLHALHQQRLLQQRLRLEQLDDTFKAIASGVEDLETIQRQVEGSVELAAPIKEQVMWNLRKMKLDVERLQGSALDQLQRQAIEKALDWTRTHPEATEWANDAASANGGMGLMPWDLEAIVADLPKEAPLEVVMRVAKERTDRVRDGTIEEQPNTDDWRAMTQAAGEALLKSAVEAAAVRERPAKASAGIALYNPELKLRLRAESSERDDDDEPTVGAPQRDEPAESALRMCKLVERDTWESLIAHGDAPSRPPKRELTPAAAATPSLRCASID